MRRTLNKLYVSINCYIRTMKQKTTKPKQTHLVTIAEYVRLVRKTEEGKNCTPQTIHQRTRNGHIIFVFDGVTPEYKIDILKYPPEKYKRLKPGPQNKK